MQVFFNTLNEKTIKEVKTYDMDPTTGGSFWSSLGGALSLCLGVSFAMLFEVIEILIDLLANIVNYVSGRDIGKAHHAI